MKLLLQINATTKVMYFLDVLVRAVEIWLLRGITELDLASYFETGSPYNIEYNIFSIMSIF